MVAYSVEPKRSFTQGLVHLKRHDILIVLLGLIPVVPMPIAGGVPVQITLLASIIGMVILFATKPPSFDRTDRMFLSLILCLFLWELIAAIYHGGRGDALISLGRGLSILHASIVILAVNEIYKARGMRGVGQVLIVSLAILLFVMVIAMIFFPKYEKGRQFGIINIPFPRTTGSPNSDGKIGTFLTLCLVFGYFARGCLPTWQRVFILVGPWLGLAATQSRSTVAAMLVAISIHWLYSLFVSKRMISNAIRFMLGAMAIGFVFLNFELVRSAIVGEGIFEKNFSSRTEHVEAAIERIPQSPLFGLGNIMARVDEDGAGIHNTFLNFAVKSGVPSTFLLILIMFFPVYMFGRNGRTFMFAASVCFGFSVEHLLYPGIINEHIILCYVVLKYACFEINNGMLKG
jgi:hypothetical protein